MTFQQVPVTPPEQDPSAWRYVCWTPEARCAGNVRIVELCPILVARFFCIKDKLLAWWDALQRCPAKQSPPVLENTSWLLYPPWITNMMFRHGGLDSTPLSVTQLHLLFRQAMDPWLKSSPGLKKWARASLWLVDGVPDCATGCPCNQNLLPLLSPFASEPMHWIITLPCLLRYYTENSHPWHFDALCTWGKKDSGKYALKYNATCQLICVFKSNFGIN